MSELNVAECEKKLEETGDKLGSLMNQASAEDKARMKEMIGEVEAFVTDEHKKGKYYDRSALFAAAIIAEPGFTDAIKDVAKEYIEIDYLFLKAKEEVK